MKKSLIIGLVLSFISAVSFAQLTPGPGHGGSSPQLIQELDVAKFDIRSTLQFLGSSGGGSNTVNAYLNDALQRIERVQQALNSSGPIMNPPVYVDLQVGELVYKGTEYSQGAKVQAINQIQGRASIKSVVSGNVFSESISELFLTRGCIYNLCVGKKVFKGSEYSQGAMVVGINASKQQAVVKSVVSGNLFVEDAANLDVAN
ncbi:MAG: hypothetical protein H7235_11800 [Bdellovibrionaceae bacterium]|nr:hypothetical protein [Pseudobdellovibrionaceae bacterium]